MISKRNKLLEFLMKYNKISMPDSLMPPSANHIRQELQNLLLSDLFGTVGGENEILGEVFFHLLVFSNYAH